MVENYILHVKGELSEFTNCCEAQTYNENVGLCVRAIYDEFRELHYSKYPNDKWEAFQYDMLELGGFKEIFTKVSGEDLESLFQGRLGVQKHLFTPVIGFDCDAVDVSIHVSLIKETDLQNCIENNKLEYTTAISSPSYGGATPGGNPLPWLIRYKHIETGVFVDSIPCFKFKEREKCKENAFLAFQIKVYENYLRKEVKND